MKFETFKKKYGSIWSSEIYTIKEIIGVGYYLKEKSGKYFFNELLHVNNKTLNLDDIELEENNFKTKK